MVKAFKECGMGEYADVYREGLKEGTARGMLNPE